MQIYADASNGGAGGGLVGGALAMALMFFVGRAGAYLVFLVILILCMVCITGKSFVSAVKQAVDGLISMQEKIWTVEKRSMPESRRA